MKLDLNKLSLKELKQLEKQVAVAIANFERNRKREAMAELEAKAKEMGFASLSEVLGDTSGRRVRKKKVAPKYRHPEDAKLQWSGRGRRPAWFLSALKSGIREQDLLIG